MAFPLMLAAAAGLLAPLAGCFKSLEPAAVIALPPTDPNFTGSFDLVIANGRPLPFSSQVNAAQGVTVTSERIVIAPDNTWADTAVTIVTDLTTGTQSPPNTGTTAGTLELRSGTIQFITTHGGGASFIGSVHADTLDVIFGSTRFEYVR